MDLESCYVQTLQRFWFQVGVMKSGKIRALDLKVYLNGGNSVDLSGLVISCS